MMKHVFFVLALAIFICLIFPKQTLAATVYANYSTGNDTTGNGSIGTPYKTFTKAYASSSANDTISLTGTFDLSNSDETGDSITTGFTISKSLTITGQDAASTIMQASSSAYTANRRIFSISGSGTTVTIQNMTLRYGYLANSDNEPSAIDMGSGSVLTVLNTILDTNANNGRFGSGAIEVNGSGKFIMRNSVMSNNNGIVAQQTVGGSWYGYTGAIEVYGTHTGSEITNTTFIANGAQYNGAILVSHSSARLTITNCTFIGNKGITSSTDILAWSGIVYLANNIFAQKASGATNALQKGSGSFVDGGNNIIETHTSSGFTNGVNGNLVGVQASLNIASSLALNSATTSITTLALSSGSVAINAGTTTANNGISIPATDARQFIRDATPDIGAYEFGATAGDTTAPIISSTATTTSSSTAIITWITNEAASSKIIFGATSAYGTSTAEGDTSPRVTSHSVTISGLVPCARYSYQIYSADAASNIATSSSATFRTIGCTGDSMAATSTVSTITTSAGGSLTQDGLTLTVPASFTNSTSSAFFQASQLDAASFFASAGLPSGKSRTGDTVFNIKALTDTGSILSTFDVALTVSLVYTPADVVGLEESTLKIYRYDGSSWFVLSNCTVDTSLKTVTCSTTAFSDFAIFGSPVASASSNGTTAKGGMSFGCRDEKASNYSNFVAHDQKMCVFDSSHSDIANSGSAQDLVHTKNNLISGLNFTRNLYLGVRGDDVKNTQEQLMLKGFKIPSGATGFFGKETKRALIEYQRTNKISPAIGFFGPKTREKIMMGH